MYASPAHLVADIGTQYIASNYVMPYLRGTLAKTNRRPRGVTSYRKPSLENRLNALQRQVNRNKAATCHYYDENVHTQATVGFHRHSIDLTDDLTSAVDFRNFINGDTFENRMLRFRIQGMEDLLACRVVIYLPKDTDDIFVPDLDDSGLQYIPDPRRFRILFDRQMDLPNGISTKGHMWVDLPLKGLRTVLDGAGNIQKGHIKIVILAKTAGVNSDLTTNIQHHYADV